MNKANRVSEILDNLQRRGLYGFDRGKVQQLLPVSPAAMGKSLERMASKGRVKRIRKGFHTIVPVEFSSQGMPPFDWFIDDFMCSLDVPYYIGLLSAAALYGAAHQQVQQLQIMVPRQERPIELPGLSIRFFTKHNFSTTPIQSHKGHAGMLTVSNPEATALDLVRYSRHIGGLDSIVTVLTELAESLHPERLVAAATESETSQTQRLGWLFDQIGQTTLADALLAAIPASKTLQRVKLDPAASRVGHSSRNRWRIVENTNLEADVTANT